MSYEEFNQMFAQFKEHYWKVSMQEAQREDVTGSRNLFSGKGAASALLRSIPRGLDETVQIQDSHKN